MRSHVVRRGGAAVQWRVTYTWLCNGVMHAIYGNLGVCCLRRLPRSYHAPTGPATAVNVTMVAMGSAPVAVLTGPAGDVPDDTPVIL